MKGVARKIGHCAHRFGRSRPTALQQFKDTRGFPTCDGHVLRSTLALGGLFVAHTWLQYEGNRISKRPQAKCEVQAAASPRTPDGRVALITGSSSGIGQAIAERLASEGLKVVISSSRSVTQGKALADKLDGAVYLQGDCSTRKGCEELIANVVKTCGTIDVLVCNAGKGKVIPHNRLDLIDDEYLQEIFSLNCFGPLWLSRAAMPYLHKAEDGCIVMISSAAGSRPMGSSIPYSMSRAAMNHLTKLLAKSHGPVRVNAVAPGLVETNITTDPGFDASREAVKNNTPLHRVGVPEDMVEAVVCCLRSRYLTGQVLQVDGGAALVF